MNHRAWFVVLGLMLLAACSPGPQPPPNTGKVIVIASDFPLQGIWQKTGVSMTDGVRFAVEQKGRIDDYQLVFKPFDDTLAGFMDTAKGIQNMKVMAADPQILGMVGPYASYVAQAEIPEASRGDLPMVSPSTTANCLTATLPSCQPPARPGGLDNFFRIAAPDVDQTTAMANFAVNQLGVTRVALLSDGASYGEGLADGFAKALPAFGGRIILRQQLEQSTNDYSEILQRIKQLGGQAIYVAGATNLGVCRVRAQMEAKLPNAYFLGGDGLIDPACTKDAGSAAAGMIATIAQGQPSRSTRAASVVAGYKKTGWPESPYTYASYDCAQILMDAIERAMGANGGKFPDRQQVIKALTTTHLEGVTGTWSFDARGDATAPAISFYRVEAGSWKFWQAVTVGKP